MRENGAMAGVGVDVEMEKIVRASVISLGVYENNDQFDDCCSEARLTLLQTAADATFGFRFTRARWAVLKYLTEFVRQIPLAERKTAEVDVEAQVLNRVRLGDLHEACLKVLGPTERVAFTMAVYSNLPRTQVAATLGITDRYLRVILGRAFRKVRESLGAESPGEIRAAVPVGGGAGETEAAG